MNIRKHLVDQIVEDLEMRFKKAQWGLLANKNRITALADEQKRLKQTKVF